MANALIVGEIDPQSLSHTHTHTFLSIFVGLSLTEIQGADMIYYKVKNKSMLMCDQVIYDVAFCNYVEW